MKYPLLQKYIQILNERIIIQIIVTTSMHILILRKVVIAHKYIATQEAYEIDFDSQMASKFCRREESQ